MIAASAAHAHTIVGDRLFPATLTIDDPGVNDELALPTFSYLTAANPDGTTGATSYTLGWEYQKTITSNLSVFVGSDGVTFQRNPRATGWADLETQLRYAVFQNAEHELIVSTSVIAEIGRTGSGQGSPLPADPFSTIAPTGYVGKGFGDLPVDWMRPFAVTGQVGYAIPTARTNAYDGTRNPDVLTYGATLQYSLLYRNAFVEEVAAPFRRLIPAVEAVFSTPIANTGVSSPGDFSVHDTTGVFGPSLYYIDQKFQLGVMMQVPINAASGKHPGVLAIVDFYLDDIFPDSIGKPLFGAPQSRRSTY